MIKEVLLDLGQLVVDTGGPNNFNVGESVNVGEGGETQTLICSARWSSVYCSTSL